MDAVKIPVVDRKRPLAARVYNYSFWGIFIIFILLFIFVDDQNNVLGKLYVLLIVVLLICGFLIKKSYNIIGHIILNDAEIRFVSNENIKTFPINELEDIQLEYLGYNGRLELITQSFDSGLGNKLVFHHSGSEFSFELFLENHHIALLRKQIDFWRINYNVRITNFLGQNINL